MHQHSHYRGPREEEREKTVENAFDKVMDVNFPNLEKKTDIQVQEVQRVPNKMKQNRSTPRNIIIK